MHLVYIIKIPLKEALSRYDRVAMGLFSTNDAIELEQQPRVTITLTLRVRAITSALIFFSRSRDA